MEEDQSPMRYFICFDVQEQNYFISFRCEMRGYGLKPERKEPLLLRSVELEPKRIRVETWRDGQKTLVSLETGHPAHLYWASAPAYDFQLNVNIFRIPVQP